jgi:hypothetical protein
MAGAITRSSIEGAERRPRVRKRGHDDVPQRAADEPVPAWQKCRSATLAIASTASTE